MAWVCVWGKKMLWGEAEVHRLPQQNSSQLPKWCGWTALLMGNINLEMTVLHVGLTSLPKLIHIPMELQLYPPFTICKGRDSSSVSLLHQEQPQLYFQTVFRVNEKKNHLKCSTEITGYLTAFIWLFPQKDGDKCLTSWAGGHRTPKMRSGPVGRTIFALL